jgi:alpha-beta hydrolase superfamily lysophospholipase
MQAAVRIGMEHLAGSVGDRPVHIIGYSTGAALALDYSLDALEGLVTPVPASLVLVSPAIRVHGAAAFASVKETLGSVPGMRGLTWLSVMPEFDPYKYNSFATNAGDVVHRLTRDVDRRIAARSEGAPPLPPILAFKSTVDATVTTEAIVDSLLARLSPNRHELVLFDINRFAAKSSLLTSD